MLTTSNFARSRLSVQCPARSRANRRPVSSQGTVRAIPRAHGSPDRSRQWTSRLGSSPSRRTFSSFPQPVKLPSPQLGLSQCRVPGAVRVSASRLTPREVPRTGLRSSREMRSIASRLFKLYPFPRSPRRPTCPERCGTLMIVVDKRCSRSPHEAIAWWGKRPVGLWIARGQSLNAAARTFLQASVLELESFLAGRTFQRPPSLVSDQIPARNGCAQIAIVISRISIVKLRDGQDSSPARLAPPAQQLATSPDFTFCIPAKQPRDQTTLSAMQMSDRISTLIPSSHANCSSCQHGSQGLLTASSSPSP